MGRVAAFLLLLTSAGVACSAGGPLVDNEAGRPYRFIFEDGSWLSRPAVFHAYLTLEDGKEIRVYLTAPDGELASSAAARWAAELNHKHPRMARASSNTLILYQVRRIELLSRLRGLEYREIESTI